MARTTATSTQLGLTADSITAVNPVHYEFSAQSQEMLKAAEESLAIRKEMELPRLQKLYGDISDFELSMILRTEKEIRQCENCAGLPCSKKNPCITPRIINNADTGYLDFTGDFCRYQKAQNLQNEIAKKFGLSKIPPEYLGKTFEDYEVDDNNSRAFNAAKKLIELPNQGVFFYGNVGTGKTLLAAILAQEVIKRGRQVIFATVPTISMQIRSTFKNNSNLTETDILEKLYKVPTLILDDVGMEKPTRFICSTIANIFNERYNSKLQTILTSNYSLKELENIFNHPSDGGETLDGTRIFDRCKQMCFPIELKGNSRRC